VKIRKKADESIILHVRLQILIRAGEKMKSRLHVKPIDDFARSRRTENGYSREKYHSKSGPGGTSKPENW